MEKAQFGAFVAQCRKEQELTQRELAEKLHVTDKAVSKWERGLSYPDVTLLEPLAETFGLSVTELISCRRESTGPQEPVRSPALRDLLTISGDSLRRERRRRRRWVAVLTLLLLGALAALTLALSRRNTVQEKGLLTVLHTEERAEGLMVLAEREEKLLQLLCSPGEDRIQAGSRLDAEYRWDRRTGRGTLLAWSLRKEALGTPMDEVGASQDLYVENGDALFGFPRVMVELVSRRPDPEGRGYLSFYVFSAGDDTEQWYLKPLQELVRFEQALGYGAYGDAGWRVLDADDDGIRELLVRTPWPEKPCILYDWEDGTLTATWLDDLPDAMVGPVA